jgi:ribA/ribD-fused uncharacterized protein
MMTERQKPGRITDTHVYFWNSIYSQWYNTKNQFMEDGIPYQNAEQYMMLGKARVFGAWEILAKMKKTDNPRVIKQLGREIKNFSDEVWDKHKMDIVTRGNFLKFSQNPDLLEILIEHKDLTLVEASPQDPVWGIGLHWDDDAVLDEKNWKGQNLLGQCIMRARDEILKI